MRTFGRLVVRLFVVVCSLTSFAQELEVSAGPNYAKLFNYTGSEYNHSYGAGTGFSACVGLNNVQLNWTRLSFELGVLYYTGNFYTSNYGWTGGSSHRAELKNTSVYFTLYPLHLDFLNKKLQLKGGLNLGCVVNSQIAGEYRWNYPYSSSWGSQALTPGLEELLVFSVVSRLNYTLTLGESWLLKPAFCYQLGITKDYGLEQPVRKMVASFELGLSRKF